ncbi:MAG: ethanolamine utilization protein EutH [Anaerovoracaceae bacterium]
MFTELVDHITDISVFTESLRDWISNLSINSIIILVMMIFMVVGAVDRVRGNKLGYGAEFEQGFQAMGPLALAMAGVVAAAPVLSILLKPIIVPLYGLLGADASIFATTLLGSDMGGYPLAMELAENETIGNFSGLILGSMMGATVVFTIPVALTLIRREDRAVLGAGILTGLITIPLGCIAGGLVMNLTGYTLSLVEIARNLIPVILFALLIIIGLWFKPEGMIWGFNRFGKGVTILITIFTAIAVFEYQTGIMFPLMDVMVKPDLNQNIPLETGLLVCGQIATVLIGAFPMVKWFTKTFSGPLARISARVGVNKTACTGLIASLANNIAMFTLLETMNQKGKLMNIAFAVSGAFVFGDHLGFAAGVNKTMIFPMIVGKLIAGITALVLANYLSPILLQKVEQVNKKG